MFGRVDGIFVVGRIGDLNGAMLEDATVQVDVWMSFDMWTSFISRRVLKKEICRDCAAARGLNRSSRSGICDFVETSGDGEETNEQHNNDDDGWEEPPPESVEEGGVVLDPVEGGA